MTTSDLDLLAGAAFKAGPHIKTIHPDLYKKEEHRADSFFIDPITGEVTINYIAGPLASEYLYDTDTKITFIKGVVGSGKTVAAIMKSILVKTQIYKQYRLMVVRSTMKDIKNTVLKSFVEWFPELTFGKYNKIEGLYTFTRKINDCDIEVCFLGLDNPKQSKTLGGYEFTDYILDECNLVSEEVYTKLNERLGRFNHVKDGYSTRPQGTLLLNTCETTHWVYDNAVKNPSSNTKLLLFGKEENIHNLPHNYYQDLYIINKQNPDWIRGYLENEWMVDRKGVSPYRNFDHRKHVLDIPPPRYQETILRGWDHTGVHPACVAAYVDQSTLQLKVFKEFYSKDPMAIADFADWVNSWCHANLAAGCRYVDVGDPAGNRQRGSEMKTARQYITERVPSIYILDGIQNPAIRMSCVDERLAKSIGKDPAVVFDKNCTWLIDGFLGAYAFKKRPDGSSEETIDKTNQWSHIQDALQYLATYVYRSDRTKKPARRKTYGGPF